ncbi:beta-microseminoprotein-like [Leucoraja erinacea]|uniref:beta-microseminoprotein-like n=1 Tax=Leucoraja erinaceus TaxID=7782 RepID=UPI00245614CF|nr:beta-microseminoprotein-like [Leucoraja erinacea]
MKLLLCIALLLLAAQLSESACFFQRHHKRAKGKPPAPLGCIDKSDGTAHDIGESWKNANCLNCVCSSNGYECCEMYSTPTSFPKGCNVLFDREACEFRAHVESDPSVECPVHGI